MELVKFTEALKTILPSVRLISIPLKIFALRRVGILEVGDLKIMMSQETYNGISSHRSPLYSVTEFKIPSHRIIKEWECFI